MIRRLFQIFELVGAIVVAKNQPELLSIDRAENYSPLRLHDVLENVHVYLSSHILIER